LDSISSSSIAYRITLANTDRLRAMVVALTELAAIGAISQATAQIRAQPCPPLFKLYVLNGEDVFFGFYPIVKQRLALPGGERDIYDLMGKDAVVFHHSAHSRSAGGFRLLSQRHCRPGGAGRT
jgi:hypothetical protein